MLQCDERCGGGAQGAGDRHHVSRPGAGAEHGGPAVHRPEGGAADDPGAGLGVPAGDAGAAELAALVDAAHDVVGRLGIEVHREGQGGYEAGGPGAHGGQVAEADSRGIPSELLVGHPRGEVPVERDDVGCGHGPVCQDGGVVAGAYPAFGMDEPAEVFDELPLSDLSEQCHRTGHRRGRLKL